MVNSGIFCTPEMKLWIRKHQGKKTRSELYQMFRNAFGEQFSNGQIRGYFQRYGELKKGESPNRTLSGNAKELYFSVQEVADMFCVNPKTISDRINRGTLKATRLGSRWGIPYESVLGLAEFYADKKLPWPALTLEQSAQLLGYSRSDYLSYAVQMGYVEAIKIRKVWFIRKSDIDDAYQYIAKTENVRVPWAYLKKLRSA